MGARAATGILSIGPLSIPYLLVVAILCLSLAYTYLLFAQRRNRRLRREMESLLLNSMLAFAAAWKLSPLLLRLPSVLSDPAVLLAAPGGAGGAAIGAAVVAAYVGFRLARARPPAALLPRPLAQFSIVAFTLYGVLSGFVPLASSVRDQAAPQLVLSSLEGRRYDLRELGGRVVVLNFWATWCLPCRAELSQLERFYRKRDTAGVELLAVNLTSTETSEEAVREFARGRALPFPVLLDTTGSASALYDVRALPTTVVIDPQGIITARQAAPVSELWLRTQASRAARQEQTESGP